MQQDATMSYCTTLHVMWRGTRRKRAHRAGFDHLHLHVRRPAVTLWTLGTQAVLAVLALTLLRGGRRTGASRSALTTCRPTAAGATTSRAGRCRCRRWRRCWAQDVCLVDLIGRRFGVDGELSEGEGSVSLRAHVAVGQQLHQGWDASCLDDVPLVGRVHFRFDARHLCTRKCAFTCERAGRG